MLLWAGNVVVSKLAAASIGPTAITFYRLVLVLLVMTPFVARPLWRNRVTIRSHWWQLALCGLIIAGPERRCWACCWRRRCSGHCLPGNTIASQA